MKALTTLFALLLVFGFNANSQYLQEHEGLYYADSSPYSGVYKTYYDNFQLKIEMPLNDGKKDGVIKIYYNNGQLHEVRSYKNNLMDGQWITYNETRRENCRSILQKRQERKQMDDLGR
jgi:antitoxin component YwqK of YwqJK toxin-antitoxin module